MSNKDLKEQILALIRLWRPILDLENWSVTIDWKEKKILAGCIASPDYKQVSLCFNLPRIQREISRGVLDLEELVVHELTHAPLWLLARGIEDKRKTRVVEFIEENATTTISRALLRARQVGELRAKRRG